MKTLLRNLIYVFLNHVVNCIPIWTVRKYIYLFMGMKIGKHSRINMKCVIMSPWRIMIGEQVMINEFCIIDGRGKLIIGSKVHISMHSIIYTASHKTDSDSFEYYAKPTAIEDNVWLGARSIVLPGSVLKKGSVIAAGSSFTGVAEENGIYSGVPAVYKRKREISEHYNCNTESYYFL